MSLRLLPHGSNSPSQKAEINGSHHLPLTPSPCSLACALPAEVRGNVQGMALLQVRAPWTECQSHAWTRHFHMLSHLILTRNLQGATFTCSGDQGVPQGFSNQVTQLGTELGLGTQAYPTPWPPPIQSGPQRKGTTTAQGDPPTNASMRPALTEKAPGTRVSIHYL